MAWSDFRTWTLALHVLFFGLSERGAPMGRGVHIDFELRRWPTRLLHGPSFGGAHALLVTNLWGTHSKRLEETRDFQVRFQLLTGRHSGELKRFKDV